MLFSIFTFADFDIVYVLMRGGPTNSTHLFATLAYQTGLATQKLGEGAPIALFLFPVLVITVMVQLHFIRKGQTSRPSYSFSDLPGVSSGFICPRCFSWSSCCCPSTG